MNAPPSAAGGQTKFRAVFYFSRRRCLKIESLAPPAARRGLDGKTIPQKDESPSEGPKNGVQEQETPCASAGDDDGQRRINSVDGRFRRKSAEIRMQIRMHFWFRRAEEAPMPTGSRAKARSHRHPYAAVCTVCTSLKRKRAEKGPTPKRGA